MNQGRSSRRLRLALAVLALALAGVALPAVAGASTPQSTATCTGSLSPDSAGQGSGEPNLLSYTFSCNQDITTYTIVVTRRARDANTIDDFESSPVVDEPGGSASATETFTCSPGSAGVPGDGFNCNAPSGTPMTAGNSAVGSLDPIDPYCKHLPPGGKPGTPAEPQAQVELVVTDSTGATDGPFTLDLTPACPAVPNRVPYPPPPKPKPTHRCSGSLRHDGTGGRRRPNLLDYTFRCDGEISAYSFIVTRQARGPKTVDAFGFHPFVLQPGGAPSPTESFRCSGRVPASGFNCVDVPGKPMSAKYAATGSFDLVDPYCKRLVPGAKPGTPAEPQAQVALLVTDATGAQRGPFTVPLKSGCSAVPNSVPYPPRERHARRHGR